ncbi:hypothetical protein ACU635_50975 [[Actinomadura] parvosata]|uniref:hypothetical protein n=1 Tax=[Actinomadura] parvosata TaxID=1955412 RepID=UPI00406CDAB6
MDLEHVVIVRASGGKLSVTGVVVTGADADAITDEVLGAATPTGEDMLVLRAEGDQIVRAGVAVPPAAAERVLADARARRVV